MKLIMAPMRVSANTLHSPSCCRLASALMSRSSDRKNEKAVSRIKIKLPMSQASTARNEVDPGAAVVSGIS